MPTRQYALERDGRKRVTVSWQGRWKNVEVTFDGESVMTMSGQEDLTAGREATLSDGSVLGVRLQKRFPGLDLLVLRDGVPLPGSPMDRETEVRSAAIVVYVVAGFNALIGLIALLGNSELFGGSDGGLLLLGFAVIFAVLGFFTQRKSAWALGVAILVFALDGVVSGLAMIADGRMPCVGIALRVVFLMLMFRGFQAMRSKDPVHTF